MLFNTSVKVHVKRKIQTQLKSAVALAYNVLMSGLRLAPDRRYSVMASGRAGCNQVGGTQDFHACSRS